MEQPKQIFKFTNEVVTRKTSLVMNENEEWVEDLNSTTTVHESTREWFEDEEGNELDMEEVD